MPTVILPMPGVTFKLAKRLAIARLNYATTFACLPSETYFEMLGTLASLDPKHPLLKSPPDYPNSWYDYSQCYDALLQYHQETV